MLVRAEINDFSGTIVGLCIDIIMQNNNSKKRILIVEDEKLICWSLENVLTKFGYEIITVHCGEKAIELFKTETFDLIITDMKLPNIDGFKVATAAKTFFPGIPVVMISAESNRVNETVNIQSAVDSFFEKPFDLRCLTFSIKDLIENKNINTKPVGDMTQLQGEITQ